MTICSCKYPFLGNEYSFLGEQIFGGGGGGGRGQVFVDTVKKMLIEIFYDFRTLSEATGDAHWLSQTFIFGSDMVDSSNFMFIELL